MPMMGKRLAVNLLGFTAMMFPTRVYSVLECDIRGFYAILAAVPIIAIIGLLWRIALSRIDGN